MNDYACIVDKHGSYVNYTALINGEPQFYELKEGEETVDVPPPPLRPHAGAHGFIRPCLENGCWAEAASPSEIEEWELLPPAPEPEAASPQDAALAQLMREVALLKIQGVKKDG